MDTLPAPAPDLSPGAMLRIALEKGGSIDIIERIAALVERREEIERKRQFAEAMNRVQAKMPTVIRSKRNTETGKLYAPVEDLQETAKPVYSAEGFTLRFSAEQGAEPGLTTVHLDVTHIGGHTERHTLPNAPLDDKGPKGGATKTLIQGLKSSLSYARGILISFAFNLTVADEDRDGQRTVPLLTPDQIGHIHGLIDQIIEAGRTHNHAAFLQFWGVPEGGSTGDLAQSNYGPAVKLLKQKLGTVTKGAAK